MSKTIDMTNRKIGRLTVLGQAPKPISIKDRATYWKCKCDCGNEIVVSGINLRRGNTKSCGCLQKEKASQLNYKNLTNQRFGKLIAISPIKGGKRIKWLCQCDCGNTIKVESTSLLLHLTQSCGCLKNLSTNEEKIKELLNQNNINYIFQYKININNKIYYFDFYVNNQYIIEFDGEQHFYYKNCKGWNNKENFLKTRNNDLEKNKYCFDNNIPIIRIPYNKEYNINDLKLETTKFLLTEENEKEYYN